MKSVDGAEELSETCVLPMESVDGVEELGEMCVLPVESVDGAEELVRHVYFELSQNQNMLVNYLVE